MPNSKVEQTNKNSPFNIKINKVVEDLKESINSLASTNPNVFTYKDIQSFFSEYKNTYQSQIQELLELAKNEKNKDSNVLEKILDYTKAQEIVSKLSTKDSIYSFFNKETTNTLLHGVNTGTISGGLALISYRMMRYIDQKKGLNINDLPFIRDISSDWENIYRSIPSINNTIVNFSNASNDDKKDKLGKAVKIYIDDQQSFMHILFVILIISITFGIVSTINLVQGDHKLIAIVTSLINIIFTTIVCGVDIFTTNYLMISQNDLTKYSSTIFFLTPLLLYINMVILMILGNQNKKTETNLFKEEIKKAYKFLKTLEVNLDKMKSK